MNTLHCGEDSVSVGLEEVVAKDWMAKVYAPDIRAKPSTMYKKPGYTSVDSDVPALGLGGNMGLKHLLLLGASFIAFPFGSPAAAQEPAATHVQLAELEIDPAQLEAYKAAVEEHIETAIRVEPGVLYAVAHKDDPARITVFEIYKDIDAYKAHLEAPHFKKYKATTEKMVKSLKLMPVAPVMLGAK